MKSSNRKKSFEKLHNIHRPEIPKKNATFKPSVTYFDDQCFMRESEISNGIESISDNSELEQLMKYHQLI